MNSTVAEAARLFEVMGANILLSGDNAVVVGMAIRDLPTALGKIASAAGISVAVLIQIAATLTVARLLVLPTVSLAGGFLLCAIAVRLLRDNGQLSGPAVLGVANGGLFRSITTVAIGYFVMCPDNILAIAAVAGGHPWLLSGGLLLSTALIIPASVVIARLMRRYPMTLTAGAGILGWVAGSMLADPALRFGLLPNGPVTQLTLPIVTAVIVVTSPLWLRPRENAQPG